MPIYEFACQSCEERFEKLVKLSDPVPECPKCGGAEVKKLVSAAGFILKGGGWYKDHYGLKSGSSSGGSSGGDGGGSSSGGSSGGDSGGSSSGGGSAASS